MKLCKFSLFGDSELFRRRNRIRFYNSNSKLVDYIYNEEKALNEPLQNKDDNSNVIKLN